MFSVSEHFVIDCYQMFLDQLFALCRMPRYVLRFSSQVSQREVPIPAWLMRPGPMLLCKHVRTSDDLAEEVELLEANPMYA